MHNSSNVCQADAESAALATSQRKERFEGDEDYLVEGDTVLAAVDGMEDVDKRPRLDVPRRAFHLLLHISH